MTRHNSRRHTHRHRSRKMRGGTYSSATTYGQYVNGSGGSQWDRTMDQSGTYGGLNINIGGYSLAIPVFGSVTLGASTAQIGSVTASISGTPSVTFTQIATHGVTIGAGTAQIGSVTATISGTPSVTFTQASVTFGTATITGSTSILNFPATQTVTFTQIVTHGVTIANSSVTVGGTVTATISGTPTVYVNQPPSPSARINVNLTDGSGTGDYGTTGNALKVSGSVTIGAGTAQIGSVTASISGTPSITFGTAVITGSTSILNFPATQTVTFTQITTHGVTIANTSVTVNGTFYQATQPVSLTTLPALVAGTAQIGSVTASISGTPSVTFTQIATHGVTIANSSVTIGGTVGVDNAGWKLLYSRYWNSDQGSFSVDTTGYSELAFQQNASAGVSSYLTVYTGEGLGDYYWSFGGTIQLGFGTFTYITKNQRIGVMTVEMNSWDDNEGQSTSIYGRTSVSEVNISNSVTIGSIPAISGTVTANSSNGSLTTRFGSVTTANTAFATSAVTNANRKYLLIQNITTAANVITVGIGFTPTTTQGIQLFAGAGLTFEGSYIPTGAVNLLSSVTASCYTILEA